MSSSDDIEENISKSIGFAKEAQARGSEIIAFPEYQLYLPDYSDRKKVLKAAESLEPILQDYVRRLAIPSLINYPELSGDRIYNTTAFVQEKMIQWKYRKLHLFNAFSYREGDVYAPGTMMPPVTRVQDVAFSTYTCYDLRFPELARSCAISGGSLLFFQAGWFRGERKRDQWLTLLRARAIENGLYVAGSAQSGKLFTGNSAIFDPNGDMLAHIEENEGIILADISKEKVDSYRSESGVISARRDDIYSLKF